jgi:hypothetical protein
MRTACVRLGARCAGGRGSLHAAVTRPSRPRIDLEGTVSTPAPPTSPAANPAEPRRKREILGPTGLVVMVLAILAFTAVSIVIEVASNHGKSFTASVDVLGQVPADPNEFQVVFHVANRGSKAGRPDICEATLNDFQGERVGTASVTLHDAIQPGETRDEPAIATAASRPVNGIVTCRSLEPD